MKIERFWLLMCLMMVLTVSSLQAQDGSKCYTREQREYIALIRVEKDECAALYEESLRTTQIRDTIIELQAKEIGYLGSQDSLNVHMLDLSRNSYLACEGENVALRKEVRRQSFMKKVSWVITGVVVILSVL